MSKLEDYRRSLPAGVQLPPDDGSNGVGRIHCWHTAQLDNDDMDVRYTFEFTDSVDENAAEMDEYIVTYVVSVLRNAHPYLYQDEEPQA